MIQREGSSRRFGELRCYQTMGTGHYTILWLGQHRDQCSPIRYHWRPTRRRCRRSIMRS